MSNVAKRRLVVFLVVPVALALAAFALDALPATRYTRAIYELLFFLLLVDIAVAVPDKWRNVVIPVASLAFCLFVAEIFIAAFLNKSGGDAPGFSVSRADLGWGPAAPGIYRGVRTNNDGSTIYDVNYTFTEDLIRKTESAPGGPAIAFFGNSMTFGQGLPDNQTLPQYFADLSGRKIRVLNFAYPGYGPQQFLRPLEVGMFDRVLTGTKIFVYQAAAWQAERASCRAPYAARAPRYEMKDGRLVYMGACAEGLRRLYSDIVLGSSFYQKLIAPRLPGVDGRDIEIYIAELVRCAQLVREKFGARLIVLYSTESAAYLAQTGFTDAMIQERLRQGGVDVVDDTLSFGEFLPGTLFTIPGDGHPTEVVARARATILYRYLVEAEPFVRKALE